MFSIYKTIAQYHYFYFQQGFSKICSHSATLQHYFSKVSAKSAPFQPNLPIIIISKEHKSIKTLPNKNFSYQYKTHNTETKAYTIS